MNIIHYKYSASRNEKSRDIFLNELVALLDVFDAKLEGGVAAVVVFYY